MFTEDRSVAACNGIVGDLDGKDCFDNGYWYSSRSWFADGAITDDAWHRVEIYFELNTIDNGVGLPNGKIRWVQDGVTLISSDAILLRTATHPNMAFEPIRDAALHRARLTHHAELLGGRSRGGDRPTVTRHRSRSL